MNAVTKISGMVLFTIIMLTTIGYAQDNTGVIFKSNPASTPKSSNGKFEHNTFGRIIADWSMGSNGNSIDDFSGASFREAFIGVKGDVTNSIEYIFEVNFAGGKTSIDDAYVKFKTEDWAVIVGKSKVPNSLEWNTSLGQISFLERAAFKSAFSFARGFGIKAVTGGQNWGFSAGIFQGDDKFSGGKEGYTGAARFTVGGNINKTTWLAGVSGRARDIKDNGMIKYTTRGITNLSMVMTNFESNATKENLAAFETAFTSGSLFGSAEYVISNAKDGIAKDIDANFSGGYVEIGYILTGESRTIDIMAGKWQRPKVTNPVDKNGNGLWMISVRYDTLNLTNGGDFGGEQRSYVAGISWYMTSYVRATFNYGITKVNSRSSFGTAQVANIIGARLSVDW